MANPKRITEDALCPFLPLWRSLLIVEITFLVLLGISVLLTSGSLSVAIPFSLVFIVPTTTGIVGLIYFCEGQ